MHLDNNLIFVSLAAYRDPQLLSTVQDCIRKASDPARLRFGICWQRDAEDPTLPWGDDSRFRVLDVNWRESKGACWARAEIMKLWQSENWFLQVDSHCRFADSWDAMLLRTMAEREAISPSSARMLRHLLPEKQKFSGTDRFRWFSSNLLRMAFHSLGPALFPQEGSLNSRCALDF